MTIKNKENQDSQAPKEIALRLRQQDNIIVSPIDLSLENVGSVNAEQIQWLNFYEPPVRLTLSNGGDTVMVRGQWSNRHQRPTLSGGPLDGNYVFSQAHFHWDSPSHVPAKHTINGKCNELEMHALFYKSNYHSQGEAQEKEDGVIIVVYFFKVEERSSFKWMTDQLGQVMAPKSTAQLPPAPLCALMVPFTENYLAYWGALACTCHHVLWLVSRTPLRITEVELGRFGKVQCILKEKIINENIKPVKTPNNVYQINPSNNKLKVLFPDAVDPPCQISTTPSKISIAVEYLKTMTSNKTANSVSGGDLNRETSCEVSMKNSTTQGKDSSTFDLDSKNKPQSSESNDKPLCSVCKKRAARVNKLSRKLSKKRCVISKNNVLEIEKVANDGTIKIREKESKKKEVELSTREKEAATELLEVEIKNEDIKLTKKALDDESKKLAEACGSKGTPSDDVLLKRLVEKRGTKDTPNDGVVSKRVAETSGSKDTQNDGVEFKRLVEKRGSKDTPNDGVVLQRVAETSGSKDTPNDGVVLKRIVKTSGLKVTSNDGVVLKRVVKTSGSKDTPNDGVVLKKVAETSGSQDTPNDGVALKRLEEKRGSEDTPNDGVELKRLEKKSRLKHTPNDGVAFKRLEEKRGSKDTSNDGVVLKRVAETSVSKDIPNDGVALKRLEEKKGSKDIPNDGVALKRLEETCGSKETPNVDDEANSSQRRQRSPIQKSVLTSKPKSLLVVKNNSHNQRENIEANGKSIPGDRGECPAKPESETNGAQNVIKEEKENKNKVEPAKGPSKSKLPVRKFTPWRPHEGLKSSLSPYFSSARGRSPLEKKPDSLGNNMKMSPQMPKYNKRIVNRTKYPQTQDLGGKGDQNTRRGQQRPMGHVVSINYL